MAISTPTAAISFSGTQYASGSNVSTTANIPAGSLIVAFLQNELNTNVQYTGFTDSAGNAYSLIVQTPNTVGVSCVAIYACVNCLHLPSAGTVSFTGGGAGSATLVQVYYVTGANGGAIFTNGTQTTSSSTSLTLTWSTLPAQSSIVFTNTIFGSTPATFTEGSGFTTLANAATSDAVDTSYQILSTPNAGSYAPTFGTSATGYGVILAVFAATPILNYWPPFHHNLKPKNLDSYTIKVPQALGAPVVAGMSWYRSFEHVLTKKTIQVKEFSWSPRVIPVFTSLNTTLSPFTASFNVDTHPITPTPQQGNFPPAGPTTQTQLIPSYIYQEYSDDDDLQAFAASYNALGQEFINTLNSLNLPIYTSENPLIYGEFLDWVGAGLYGYPRPALYSGQSQLVGPLNTWQFNSEELNGSQFVGYTNVVVTTDDTYQRLLTWAFYKGDGKYFTIRDLKRKIMRFLIGPGGTAPNIDQTYQISVTFGSNQIMAIRFIDAITTVTSSFELNTCELNSNASQLNSIMLFNTPLVPLPNRQLFKEAVQSGAIELPFQYTWDVQV